jgi:hypothetical protein
MLGRTNSGGIESQTEGLIMAAQSRFRFSVRDVFWLMLVVACLSGWAAHHARWEKHVNEQFDQLRATIRKMAGTSKELAIGHNKEAANNTVLIYENDALKYAIKRVLSREQYEQVQQEKQKYVEQTRMGGNVGF